MALASGQNDIGKLGLNPKSQEELINLFQACYRAGLQNVPPDGATWKEAQLVFRQVKEESGSFTVKTSQRTAGASRVSDSANLGSLPSGTLTRSVTLHSQPSKGTSLDPSVDPPASFGLLPRSIVTALAAGARVESAPESGNDEETRQVSLRTKRTLGERVPYTSLMNLGNGCLERHLIQDRILPR